MRRLIRVFAGRTSLVLSCAGSILYASRITVSCLYCTFASICKYFFLYKHKCYNQQCPLQQKLRIPNRLKLLYTCLCFFIILYRCNCKNCNCFAPRLLMFLCPRQWLPVEQNILKISWKYYIIFTEASRFILQELEIFFEISVLILI